MDLKDKLPLHYEDGPDYCTVTDGQHQPFCLTVQPELLKVMEVAYAQRDPLRRCGYCNSWGSKPCGEGCHWSPTDPTAAELAQPVF